MTDPLSLKTVHSLLGKHFYIPHYQRGYRWTDHQVKDLLNDIWAFTKPKEKKSNVGFYCLQPIVVKQKSWQENGCDLDGFEVIDGQQRLTTIYIVLSYLAKEFLLVESLIEDYGEDVYSLRYETKPDSERFLKDITEDKSNIDYYHIYTAYNTVKEWFENGGNVKDRSDRNSFLGTLLGKEDDERSVKVIWYEIERKGNNSDKELKNSIELFTRLNIGKIPLTNAELIKALFLSSSSFQNELHDDAIQKKMEISQIWDDVELKLSDENFWAFISNKKKGNYATKIELLFDLVADKKDDEVDPLHTFLHFLNESRKYRKLWNLWIEIERYYFTLCEWYRNKNLYHKIGYLISTGARSNELISLALKENKNKFEAMLDKEICSSISHGIEGLSYEIDSDYKKIENILLLFNIESIRRNTSITEFYPFKSHKNIQWSLEHIHAQNSESLDRAKREQWIKWLDYHSELIKELFNEEKNLDKKKEWADILSEVDRFNNEKLTWEKFTALGEKITIKFSENGENQSEGLHSISNLALLSQRDNAALNNSVFEVKRRKIIEMDKNGVYIPLCTRRVFLKYYNSNITTQQNYFWGKKDRISYMSEIKSVLKDYLPKEMKSD